MHHVNPCLLDSSKTTSLVLLALARASIHKHQFGSPKLILRRGSACLAASRRWLRLFLLGLAKARVTELFLGGWGALQDFTLLKGPVGIHKNQFRSPKLIFGRGGAGGGLRHMLNPCVPGGYQAMASMFLFRRGGAGHAEPLRAWRLAGDGFASFFLAWQKHASARFFWGGSPA